MKYFLVLFFVSVSLLAQSPLCSFENEAERGLIHPGGAKTEIVQTHASHGTQALKAVFPGSPKDSWPGISFRPDPPTLLHSDVLSFDVYNPGKEVVRLSWRIDAAEGKRKFGGEGLQPRKTQTIQIFLKALDEELKLETLKQFYLYQRMPRKDVILYFDNFRVENFADSFVPLTYRHRGGAAEPGKNDLTNGFQLFQRPWTDLVFPASRARPGETEVRLDAFATPGETEPLVFSVCALRPLKSARVRIAAPLVSKNNDEIPVDAFRIYPVRNLDKRVVYSSKDYIKDVPVLLERREEVDIPEGVSKRFWLNVHVPAETKAGIYRGSAQFQAGGKMVELPIRIRVLPFVLPEAKDMIFGEYYRGPALARDTAEKIAFLKRDLRDMRDMGMTSVGLCFGIPSGEVSYEDGEARFAFSGKSLFENFMDTYRDLGFPAPIVLLSDSGKGFARNNAAAPYPSEAHKKAYQAFWRGMQAECRKRGWAELIVQPVDEPGWKGQDEKDLNVQYLKWLKEIPGMRTEQDGPGDAYFHNAAGPHADVWNYNGGFGSPEMVRKAKRNGHLVLIYNCDVESYRPEVQRYSAGFFQKRAGGDGCYNWAYTSFSGSPYSDFDFKTGTWMHVYPKWKDEPGGSSIGWQGFREGIDDYKYILAFEDAVMQAEKRGGEVAALAAVHRHRFQDLLGSIDYKNRLRNGAKFTEKEKAAGKGYVVGGEFKVANGWSLQTYDVARWQLAQGILELRRALSGEKPPATAPGSGAVAGELVTDLAWTERAVAPGGQGKRSRQVEIRRLETDISVDGKLDEATWKQAARLAGFRLLKGGRPQAATVARVFNNGRELCFGITCVEPYTSMMTAGMTEDGGALWKDDCVELFFDHNLDQKSFRQIIVNSLGKFAALDSSGKSWSPKVEVGTQVLEDKWQVELKLPLADLGLSTSSFGFNLCRERRPTEVLELSCWAPTGSRFGNPDRFGLAVLGASFLEGVELGAGLIGANEMKVLVRNREPRALEMLLETTIKGDAGSEQKLPPASISLKSGEQRAINLSYVLRRSGEEMTFRVVLRDRESGRQLAEQRLFQTVANPLAVRISPPISFVERPSLSLAADLWLAPGLLGDYRLEIQYLRGAGGEIWKRMVIPSLEGDTLNASLNLGSASGGGVARIHLGTKTGGAPPLAVVEIPLSRVAGPFAGK